MYISSPFFRHKIWQPRHWCLFSNEVSESPNTDPWVAQVSSLLQIYDILWYRIISWIIIHAPWFSKIWCHFFADVGGISASSWWPSRASHCCSRCCWSVDWPPGATWKRRLWFNKKETFFEMSLWYSMMRLWKIGESDMTFLELLELLIPCWSMLIIWNELLDEFKQRSAGWSFLEFQLPGIFSESENLEASSVGVQTAWYVIGVFVGAWDIPLDPETWSDLNWSYRSQWDLNGSGSHTFQIQFISNSYPIDIRSSIQFYRIYRIYVMSDERFFSDEVMMAAGVVGVWVRMKIIWVAVLARKKRECAWFKSCVFVPWQRESLWVLPELHRANWCQDNS